MENHPGSFRTDDALLHGSTGRKIKPMNTISICLLWCLLWTGTASTPSQVPLNPEDGIYTTGEWKYQCVVLGAGTPEQKVTGKLSFKGKEVVGTPFARL